MNHTIKFRGKPLSTGGWVYGYYYVAPKRMYADKVDHCIVDIYGAIFAVDPKTVGQYIGKKDKEGEEIYEDDICDGHSDGYGIIKWDDGECAYIYVFDDGNSVGLWETENLEVIGNLTDNPDLFTQ